MLSISHIQLSFFHCMFPYPIVSGIASMIELDSQLWTLDIFETKCKPTRPIGLVALFTGMRVAGLLVLSVY